MYQRSYRLTIGQYDWSISTNTNVQLWMEEIGHLFSWPSNCSSCTQMFPGEGTCVTRTLMSLTHVGRIRLGFSSSEAGGVRTTDRGSSSNGGSHMVISKGWVSLIWLLIKQEKNYIKYNGSKRKYSKKEKRKKERQNEIKIDSPDGLFLWLTVYWKQRDHFWPVYLQYWHQCNHHQSHTDTQAQV